MTIHDGEIIARSIEQRASFAELYDRHERVVYRYAARRLGSSQADDITSETFLVAFTRRADFIGEDARPWLLGIATTLMHQYARHEAKAWRGMLASDLARVDVDQFEATDARLDAEAVARKIGWALARLPAGDRDALLLHTFGHLNYEGISEALSIPVGTVRSRLTVRAANSAPRSTRLQPEERKATMDEISLLRRARNDIPERTPEQIARGRAALFVHLDSDLNSSPRVARRGKPKPVWVGFSVLGTAALVVALVVAANVVGDLGASRGVEAEGPPNPPSPTESFELASAVTVLKSAAMAAIDSKDPVVSPGQYLLVTTNTVVLTQGTIEADSAKIQANGGNIEDEDLVGFLQGERIELYIPANRDDEWVEMRYVPTVVATFGPKSETFAQEGGGVGADNLLRLPGGAYIEGDDPIDSYFLGNETVDNYDLLPRDPQQLLDAIYDTTVDQGSSRDGAVLVWIADVLRYGTVPADLRAALYETAAKIPGVTITEQQATLDGTTGIAIGRDEANGSFRQDIIIDPTTGQFIGERQVLLEGLGDLPAGTVITSSSVTTTVVDSAP